MPAKFQTAAEERAIQRLIRAKSDREIARLLRQSYRLLNLHRRRRSSVSHRERWTNYELRLLGRIRDEELSKLLRRSTSAIAAKREALGIPIFASQRSFWSKREIELLGKRPDPVVARMLGRSRYAVQLKRHSLGIPSAGKAGGLGLPKKTVCWARGATRNWRDSSSGACRRFVRGGST